MENIKYYTVPAAAIECNVTKSTILNAIRKNRLPATQIPDGNKSGFKYMIAEHDLIEYIENKGKQAPIVTNKYSEMTIEQVAGKILDMLKEAYREGYENGTHDTKAEMLKKLNEV